MNQCDMTGCYDIAGYTLEYTNKETQETLEICESCAEFWRGCFLHEDETATVRDFANTKAGQL
jgi:hypothetical protein